MRTDRRRTWAGCVLLLVALAVVAPVRVRSEDEGPRPGPHRFAGIDGVDPFAADASAEPRLALLGGAGDLLVRTRPIPWGRIEPHAPVMDGRHLHDWETLDRFVAAWHVAGFEVVPVLSPESPWATVPPQEADWSRQVAEALPEPDAGLLVAQSEGSGPPRAAHWADWERFVQVVAERYDGDGHRDAPGLVRPVRWIQIVDHPASPRAWTGSPEQYLRLLHLASQGAAKASAAVRVVHGAVDFEGLGHSPRPDDTALLRRLVDARRGSPPAALFEARRGLSFALLTLSMRRLYGAVAHRGSAHVADESVDLAFLRARLDADGRADPEVWLVDTPAAKLGPASVPRPSRPSPEEAQRRARARASALREVRGGVGDGPARAWLDRGQAYDVVRTVCAALAAGASRVFLGGDDGAAAFVRESPGGPGDRAPAWFALRQVAARLAGHRTVSESQAGRNATVYRVAFDAGASLPWLVVVVRDPDRSWAGDPREGETREEVVVRLPDGEYVVEETALGANPPPRRRVRVTGGVLRLELTPAPVYVHPEV